MSTPDRSAAADASATDPAGAVPLVAPDGVDPAEGAGLPHRQIVLILSGLMLGMFLAALDQTVVATSIRVIGDDLQDLSAQAWVTTAFLITSTIATPLYGKLSDIYGRKPFFLFAITVFVAGSALCSFATSMYMLAGFRALQGIGAGGLFTLALAIVGDIVAPRQRARYQGYFLAVFGTSSVLGPLVGGVLSGQESILGVSGWRWIFLVNVPVGIAAFLVVTAVLKLPVVRHPQRIDYLGAAVLVVAIVPLLLVAEEGRNWGWRSIFAVACYLVGAAGVAAFVAVEARQGDAALLPLRLFRNRAFSLAAGQTAIIGMGMFGGITVLPLYLQIVKGASPTESGLLMIPMVLGIMVASVVSGQLTSRTGHYRIFPILGSALMVVGLLVLWRLSAGSSYWHADAGMLILGTGLGLTMQTLTLAMQNAVPRADMGVATASSTFFRQIGGTLGVAIFLSVLYSGLPGKLGSAFTSAAADPEFQQAARTDPAGAALLRSPALIDDSSALSRLPAALTQPWKDGFTAATTVVFLIAACIVAVAVVLSLVTPELPLRSSTAPDDSTYRTQGPTAAEPATAAEPGGPARGPVTAGHAAAGRATYVAESPVPAVPTSTERCRERGARSASRAGDRTGAGTFGRG